MSRGGNRRRLTRTLPVILAFVGAGITAAKKRRAARHTDHGLMDRIEPVGQSLAPMPVTAAPVEAGVTPAPPESSAGVAETSVKMDSAATESAPAAPASRSVARGAVKTAVLEALAKGGAMTASEIAATTGTGRATVSSTLTRLARSGEVAKAERGYQLPDAGASAATPAKKRAAKPTARKAKSTKASSKPSPARRRTRAPASAASASTPSRTAPGATKANVLAALSKDQGATSGEVATATGITRGTVSTTLSRLVKTGEVVKAERGYVLPS
jgi:DNA-binding MarR family transcriptional regulator